MGESHAAFAAMETTLNWIVPENITFFNRLCELDSNFIEYCYSLGAGGCVRENHLLNAAL